MTETPDVALWASGDVARAVEMARQAAAMDVVPAWATAPREGPVADVAPLPAARVSEERSDAGDE